MKKILFCLILSASFTIATSGQTSTGFMSPSVSVAPNGWTDPDNAFDSDDTYATASHISGCNCPFVYLSWNNGSSFSSYDLLGPFSVTDGIKYGGGSADTWGHSWTDTEFSNPNFMLKITNSSMSIQQGYGNFNFGIPAGATINGIEVKVEAHGDAGYSTDYVDQIQVNVYYTPWTGIGGSVFAERKVAVYPNPVHEQLFVENRSGEENISVEIIDMQGQVLKTSLMTPGKSSLDVDGLANGIYFIRICSGDWSLREKVIKN